MSTAGSHSATGQVFAAGPMFERLEDFRLGATPERRQEPRIAAIDGAVEIDGETYPVRNCSARGFLATSCAIECDVTQGLDIRFRARLGKRMLDIACRAIVVRIDADRQLLTGRFAKGDDAAVGQIAQYFAAGAAG